MSLLTQQLYYKKLILDKYLEFILKYQKNNNITRHCITNVQYYRDHLKIEGYSPVVKPAICISTKNNNTNINFAHLVIVINNTSIIDPSYEFKILKDKLYFHSIGNFIKYCKNNIIYNRVLEMYNLKDELDKFVNFIKYAKDINNNKLRVVCPKYYNKLADYVENRIVEFCNQNNIDVSFPDFRDVNSAGISKLN